MHKALALVSLVLASTVAAAENEIELAQGVVRAKFGIRFEGTPSWSQELPQREGAAYLVKKANGLEYRLVLHRGEGSVMAQGATSRVSAGTFRLRAVELRQLPESVGVRDMVKSLEGASRIHALVVRDNGTYELGDRSGTWRKADGQMIFDGLGVWKVATVDDSGLVFHFDVDGRPAAVSFSRVQG